MFKKYVRDNDFTNWWQLPLMEPQQCVVCTLDLLVMTLVLKLINSIRAKALQHRLFKALLDELDVAYGDLLLHADIR